MTWKVSIPGRHPESGSYSAANDWTDFGHDHSSPVSIRKQEKDPRFYDTFTKTYNLPELIKEPVSNGNELIKAIH